MKNDHNIPLMTQVAKGDANAFRSLSYNLNANMFGMCLRLMNGNRAMAEDAYQDALIKLWQTAPSWKPLAPVSVWAGRIVWSVCMDIHRKQKSARHIGMDAIENYADDHESAFETLAQKDEHHILLQHLNTLPKRQQHALLLTYFHENKRRDVAAIMKLSEKAVEHLVARGLENLRATMKKPDLDLQKDSQSRRMSL